MEQRGFDLTTGRVFDTTGAIGLGLLLCGCIGIVLPSATGLDTQSMEGIKVGSTTRQEIREGFGKLPVHLDEGRFAVYQATTNQLFFAGLFAGPFAAEYVATPIPTGNASTYRILVEFDARDVVSRYVVERTGYLSDVESRSVDERTGDATSPDKGVESPSPRVLLGKYYVNSLAFSGDGQKVAGGTSNNRLLIWNPGKAGEPMILKGDHGCFPGFGFLVSSVSISPDGKTAVSGGMDGLAAVLWNVDTGTMLRRIPEQGDATCGARNRTVITPDGRIVAMTGKDDLVTWWDITTGKELGSINALNDLVHAFAISLVHSKAFSPDGQLIAITDGRRVEVRRFQPQHEPQSVEGVKETLVSWSSLGELVAVFILPALTGLDEDPRSPRPALIFSPDGQRLAASYNSVVLIWDVASRRELWRYLPYSANGAISRSGNILNSGEIPLAWSPNGKMLATSVFDAWSGSHSVALWDVPASEKPASVIK
jgi:WD40 repeat protein